MTVADPPAEDIQDEVLDWMEANKRGYKAAGKHFGIPHATIANWARARRDGRQVVSRARVVRARDPDPAPTVPSPLDAEEPWDPTTCTREVWLRRGMVRAMERSEQEQAKGHGGTAARWETQAGKYRDELDKLLEERRLAGLVPEAVNAVQLSRELAELVPMLVRLDLAFWLPVVILLVQEVARYKGGVWAEFAERLKGER